LSVDRLAPSAARHGGVGRPSVLPGLPARDLIRRWLTSFLKIHLRVVLASAAWLATAKSGDRHER
jgi:hypothetical protein